MRKAIAWLLAVNILVLLWHLLRSQVENDAPVPVAGSQVVLLSELEHAQLQSRERCWLVGPLAPDFSVVLEDVSSAVDSEHWLIRELAGDQQRLHRVYVVPPAAVVAGVFLSELNAAIQAADYNIDSYIVAEGNLAGSISLGLFADAANAARVHAQLEVLGYEPVTSAESRSTSRQWLQLWYQNIEDQVLQSLLARFNAMGLAVTENLCETIAHQK